MILKDDIVEIVMDTSDIVHKYTIDILNYIAYNSKIHVMGTYKTHNYGSPQIPLKEQFRFIGAGY